MKKIILPILIVLVFGISVYTVTNFNKNKSKNLTITKEENSKDNNATPDTDTDSTIEKDVSTVPDKTPASNFKLKDLSGKEVSLSDFKGKKVFLNFWASWCPPCKAEMPDMQKLYEQTKDSDLVILAVNLGESKNEAKSFIDDNKYNFTVLLDSDKNIATQYNVSAIPTSFFIDAKGNIVRSNIGAMTLEEMNYYISEL